MRLLEDVNTLAFDRPSNLRLGLVTATSIALVLSFPGTHRLKLGAFYLVVTAISLGLALSRKIPKISRDDTWDHPELHPIGIWVICTLGAITYGKYIYGLTDFTLWDLNYLNVGLSLRSIADVLLLAGVLMAMFALLRWARYKSSLIWSSTSLAMITLVSFAAWTTKMAGVNYVALWAPNQVSEEYRFLALFDICNSLWLGAILPLALVRSVAPEAVRSILDESMIERTGWSFVQLLLTIPMAVGIVVNYIIAEGSTIVDVLPITWWLRKFASMFLWTALQEEVAYRVIPLALITSITSAALNPQRRLLSAVVISTLCFAVVHGNQGWIAVLGAIVIGSTYSFVLMRTRNIEICIIGHVLLDVILLRWN